MQLKQNMKCYIKLDQVQSAAVFKMSRKTTQHIRDLSVTEKREFIDSFDTVLFDCDGVIWLIADVIPDTGPAIKLLKAAGKQCKFVTNNSLRTDKEYQKKLEELGVPDVHTDDVMHTVKVMIKILKKQKPGEKVFSLCSKEANESLRANDIDFSTPAVRSHWVPKDFITEVDTNDKVGAVLFDINLDLTFMGLAKANQYLKDPNCLLICGGTDAVVAVTRNFQTTGFSDFIDHLSQNSQKDPIIASKPSSVLGDILIEAFNIEQPQRCLFIGDSLRNDILFAKTCGFQTLYVLTGVGRKDQMLQAEGNSIPDYCADSLADFRAFFANLNSQPSIE